MADEVAGAEVVEIDEILEAHDYDPHHMLAILEAIGGRTATSPLMR